MRTKVTLVLIFLNVALFFFIFKFERNWRTEAASLEARRRVLGAEAADIRLLHLLGSNGATVFRLERHRDTWLLKQPLDWPAKPHAANSMVNALQLLEHEASFTVAEAQKNGQSLADFGLENPKLKVAFASGDAAPSIEGAPATQLHIGDASSDGKRLYVLSPSGQRIHVVSRSLLDALSTPIEQLREDEVISIRVFEARSLNIQTGGADAARTSAGARVRIRREGARWTFDAPITARASSTAVELALKELHGLKAKSFPAAPPPTLPVSAPSLRIAIEGNNHNETLYLGEPVAAAAPNAAAMEYYAQLDGRSALFTVAVPIDLLKTLRNAQEDLREKRILDFDPRAVTSIALAAPIQPNLPPITLQRLDPPAGQPRDAAAGWQVVRRGEGTQGPQTLPGDAAAVQRLLDRLSLLNAVTFKSDAPTSADIEDWGFNRPIREVTITRSDNNVPLVLRIGSDAARQVYYARVGTPNDPGTSVYTIDREIVDSLSLEPLAWRDRSVAAPLPESARIVALKLTDLSNRTALFETTFNAEGAPATAPRDPNALQQVVAALRHLRAKEFVGGGFTERLFAAGDERPWRFQLEATIALPGATTAAQTPTLTLFLTERLGGGLQFAGSRELDVVFALEQPFIDALWSLTYGARDPGPPTTAEKR